MLAQGDQNNIVYGYFPAKDDYVNWANIALAIFLCNVASVIFRQH